MLIVLHPDAQSAPHTTMVFNLLMIRSLVQRHLLKGSVLDENFRVSPTTIHFTKYIN